MKIIRHLLIASLFTTMASAKEKELSATTIHRYLWANYNQFGGKLKTANAWYDEIFKSNNPVYAYKGYVHLLYDAGHYDRIVHLLPLLDKPFEQDPDLGLLFVQSLERLGQRAQADARIIRLSSKFPTNQEVAFHAAQAHLHRKEPENALSVIDKLLNTSVKKPNNFIFYFLKAQIYIELNNKEKALENVRLSLELHPQFDKGWLLLALLEEQAGKLDDAIKGYANFLEIAQESNKEIEQHLLMLIFKQKVSQKNKNVFVIKQSCFDKTLLLFEKKEYAKALKEVDQCFEKNPKDTSVRLLKIQILNAMNKSQEAVKLLTSWILKEPKMQQWFKTLHLLYRSGTDHTLIIKALKTIEKAQPHSLMATLYLADLYTRVGNAQAALKQHQKALALTEKEDLQIGILFQIALTHYENHRFNDMKQVIERGRKLKKEFPPFLNLLAYYHATYGNKLDEAQKLISLALKHDGANPYFLDTQALIYYKEQDYDEALKILKRITRVVEKDFTILEHLGKTEFKKGMVAQSIKTIEKAQVIAQTKREKQQSEKLLKQWRARKRGRA